MEGPGNPESQESIIDTAIEKLAEIQEMDFDDILAPLLEYVPYEGNEADNPEYVEELAEMLEITVAELTEYALKKRTDMGLV